MFYDQFGNQDGDQLVFARSTEGHSHITSGENAIKRYKVGDEIAIAGILKVSAIQPNRNGTVSYSFDRGFALHENMVEQMALKPYEKPVQEEVVQKPRYTGKVVAINIRSSAGFPDVAASRIGHIFEIKNGVLIGDQDDLYKRYGFVTEYDVPCDSFENFCVNHFMNEWLEIKD